MARVRNPFILAGPVAWSQFVGREAEAKAILDGLAHPHTRTGFAICGGPRVGKTSLLRYVSSPEISKKWGLTPDRCIFIKLDCPTIRPFTPARFWQEALTLMEEKLGADLKQYAKACGQQERVTPIDLQRFFNQVASEGTFIVLLLDDFDPVADEMDDSIIEFLYSLRVLACLPSQGLVVIVASCKPLSELFHGVRWSGSPPHNHLHPLKLQPLRSNEVNELLKRTLEGTGVTFGEEDFAYAQQVAGGHPSLVQLAGWLLFEWRLKAGQSTPDYAAIAAEFNDWASAYFDELCKGCDELERELLVKISVGDPTAHQLLERHSEQKRFLQKRGLIIKGKAGYELFSPSFQEWVYENKDRLARKDVQKSSESLPVQRPVDIQQLGEDWEELLRSISGGDAEQKGKALETFTANMFQLIPGIRVLDRNLRSASEEIDIVLCNESNHAFWQTNFDNLILVECKNWNAPVGTQVIRNFHGILQRKGIKAGFLVAMEGITGSEYRDAMLELRSYLGDRINIVIPIDRKHLQRIVGGENPTAVLKDALYELYRI